MINRGHQGNDSQRGDETGCLASEYQLQQEESIHSCVIFHFHMRHGGVATGNYRYLRQKLMNCSIQRRMVR
jgi:hypothetical protein